MRHCILVALAACSSKSAPSKLDDYGEVPAFTVRDQTGAELTEDWLRGKATIVDFVFTRCDTICPTLTLKMARLDTQLPEAQLLSFSVDPTHDTPPVLLAYASHYHADAARWRFVTGEYDAVKQLVEGALMTAMDDQGQLTEGGAPDIRHGGHFLLIGPDLHIRGVYDSSEQSALDALVSDVKRIAGSAGRTTAGTAPRT